MAKVRASSKSGFEEIPLPATDPIFGNETIILEQPSIPGGDPTTEKVTLSDLRQWISGQFGIRLQSTGDAASPGQTHIVLQTRNASITNPYLVQFDQFILTPFTGPGQFDLVERDASDPNRFFSDCITVHASPLLTSIEDNFTPDMVSNLVACEGVPDGTTVLSYQNAKQVTLSANATADTPPPGITCTIGGKTKVTIATKAGFTDGDVIGSWSYLRKAITSDKIYSVVFVPGTAGDGIYSMKISGLNQGQN